MAQHYRVSGVPKTVIDERIEILGAQPEEAIISQILDEGSEGPLV